MARQRGGVSKAPKTSPKPSKPDVRRAPPPPSTASSVTGGLGSTVADGMAWGVGNAIAHRAADAVMGPRVVATHEAAQEAGSAPAGSTFRSGDCRNHMKSFQDCLNAYADDIGKCQFYLDMLTECRKTSNAAAAV